MFTTTNYASQIGAGLIAFAMTAASILFAAPIHFA